MKKFTYTVAALALMTALPGAAHAQEKGHISLGLGYYDIGDDDGAADFRLEYRPNHSIHWENLKPWIGAEITSDASVWGGGGLLYDWEINQQLHVIPSLGVGVYGQGDSDKDLDYPIQFRSQLELGYSMPNADRVGVAFSHLSNASLGDDNPGAEVLNLYYHYGF